MKKTAKYKDIITLISGGIILAGTAFRDLRNNSEINWVADIFIAVVAMLTVYWAVHIPDRSSVRAERRRRNKHEPDNQ